ncbi:MAG: chemotaxis protein CheA, partial [Planctomycetes bacterium]|nr:chemotaxis protein CheA [Planctomycetota bacterium]
TVSRNAVEDVAEKQADRLIGQALVKENAASGRDVAKGLRTQRQMAGGGGESSVRVGTQRLDGLINAVGELVITHAMIAQREAVASGSDRILSRAVSQLGKIARELQDVGLSLRMVPLKAMFQRMARLVRDLARKADKTIQLVTDGEETEIDRNMVEALSDPLVHMMRNSADHGIESPAERRAAGKPEAGIVSLRAYHRAGSVVIELGDDGRGLDPQKILAKARAKGLVGPDETPPDEEIYKLIFAPGLSTAESVTDISGRGVGMDVVKRNIEALRGRVQVTSKPGSGTTFTIRLPLTLAIIDGMLIQVGGQIYILPTLGIQQAFRPGRDCLYTVKGRGEIVTLRDSLIPIFRLHRYFGVPEAQEDPAEALLVVLENEGRLVALLADALLGQQQVVIKSLGAALGDVDGVSGAAILGDGRVGLILDPAALTRAAWGGAHREVG